MPRDAFDPRPLIADRFIAEAMAEGCDALLRLLGRLAGLLQRLGTPRPIRH